MHIATKSRGRHSGKASMRSPAEVEAKKFTKQLGRRRRLAFLIPDKSNVHAGDVGGHRPQLDALAVERPWPVHHVGEDRDAHSGCDHAAHGLDRGGADDRSWAKTGRLPVTLRGLACFIEDRKSVV